MRIKFIRVEETLETRGKKAAGRVPRSDAGDVIVPSGGERGTDTNPAKPTGKLKKMVRRWYLSDEKKKAAKAAAAKQNASTELFGNKIVEGFNRLIEEYTGKDDPKKAQDYASPEAQAARKARDERRLAALKTKEGEKKSTEKVGKFVKKVRSVKGIGNPGEPGFISGQGRRSAIQRSIAAETERRAQAGHGPAKTPPRPPKK